MKKSILLVLPLIAFWAMDATVHGQQTPPSESSQWSDSVSVGVVEKGWKFEAWLYKPRTAWCEPIYFRTTITNVSDTTQPMPLLTPALPYLGITIRDSNGNRMPFMRPHVDPGLVDTALTLAAGDSSAIEFDLLWLAPRYGPSIALPAYRPGEYTMYLSLYLDTKQQADRVENTLLLPALKFTVVEPTGDSAEALRLLNEGSYHRSQHPEYAEACYDSVLVLYSDTPYEELTNIELIYFRCSGPHVDRSEHIRWSERYFLKYPDTPFAPGNAGDLVSKISRDRMKELTAIVAEMPNSGKLIRHLREQHPWIFEEELK